MGGLDDLLDNWQPFGAVAVEQPLIPATTQEEVELPDEVPNIVQPRIHALSTKWAMNVSGVAGDEDTADPHLRDVPVMDAKVAAPVKRARLNLLWRTLSEYLLHEFQRGSVSFRLID
jgi:hypothetical protein